MNLDDSDERGPARRKVGIFTSSAHHLPTAVETGSPFVYGANGKPAYLLTEGRMYAAAFITAINDAGSPWPGKRKVGKERHEAIYAIVDGLKFLLDPDDDRRYTLAAAAGVDAEMVDILIAAILDPAVEQPRVTGGVQAGATARIRERAAHPRAQRSRDKYHRFFHRRPVASATLKES